MKIALEQAGNPKIDYLNPHGTSTPVGDAKEMEAVRAVFGDDMPMISSTKSLTGHSLGATGVHEAIYSLLMMEGGFIAASANITQLDPEIQERVGRAIRVRFADNSARAMLLLGHLLGNQHAPVDVDEDAVTVPLFTSAEAAREMLTGIGVVGEVIEMALAGQGWARTSADDHAGHHH